jgi:hypothetical protein
MEPIQKKQIKSNLIKILDQLNQINLSNQTIKSTKSNQVDQIGGNLNQIGGKSNYSQEEVDQLLQQALSNMMILYTQVSLENTKLKKLIYDK